jgi:hypothetical protein
VNQFSLAHHGSHLYEVFPDDTRAAGNICEWTSGPGQCFAGCGPGDAHNWFVVHNVYGDGAHFFWHHPLLWMGQNSAVDFTQPPLNPLSLSQG